MFRSASAAGAQARRTRTAVRVAGTAGAAAVTGAALVLGGGTAAAGTTSVPSPAATPYVTPSGPPPGPVAKAPILDLTAPVLGLELPVSSLDGSLTDVTGAGRQKIIVAADVLFAFNRATLTPAAKSRIDAVAQALRERAKGKPVTVDGFTDAKGADAYNLALSQRRAEAVRGALDALVRGSGVTFTVRGRGEAAPIAPNTTKDGADNPKGRAKNRRVEISFTT